MPNKRISASNIPLQLYNTETRQLEEFIPQDPKEVTVYTCGPTVYDYAHIGNFRSFVFADILRKVLSLNGHTVRSTINFTDFGHLTDDADAGEDKILRGMKKAGLPFTLESMRSFTAKYIDAFKLDATALNIAPPTNYARASDFVPEQIQLIQKLSEQGQTYETSDGLYFKVQSFPSYGRLGNIDLDRLQEGARVNVNPEKEHPADFALWKKGDLGWDSPWGRGFPGWHIECSAMAIATLGESIDIHTGGIDHIHTHHNAEIAQSESCTGHTFARYWLHNAFITIDDTKIAKSLGNSLTIKNLTDQGFHPEAYRYWLLMGHYRSTVNFSFDALIQATHALQRLKQHRYGEYRPDGSSPDQRILQRFHAAINNDLDTPKALSVLWEMVRSQNIPSGVKAATMETMDAVLGIGLSKSQDAGERDLGLISEEVIPETIQELLAAREKARKDKDWRSADKIREQIEAAGYAIVDTVDGPKVRKSS